MGAYFISQFIKQSLQLSSKNSENNSDISSFLQPFSENNKGKSRRYYHNSSHLIDMLK